MNIASLQKQQTMKSRQIVLGLTTFFAGIYIVCLSIYLQQYYEKTQTNITQTSADISKIREIIRNSPVYIKLPGAKPIKAIVEDYSSPESIWQLVNRTHSLSSEFIPTNIQIPDVPTRTDKSVGERSVRTDITKPLKEMFDAAASYSYQLVIGSGYRSANLQSTYFNSAVAANGPVEAAKYVAQPGQSEHQTGLAVDITTVSRACYLTECFADTSDGQWLAKNSYKYGFILRYPSGKESITGYNYEPWHFRYVGVDLATALFESKLTLEEANPYLLEAQATLKKHGAL